MIAAPRRSQTLSDDTLALIIAGGGDNGSARWYAKHVLPFGAHHSNFDFPLSNCVASDLRHIALVTPTKSHELVQYVQQASSLLRPERGEFVEVWSADRRRKRNGYASAVDGIHQNIDLLEEIAPERVLILGGNQIYRMDYRELLAAHVAAGVGATVCCVSMPLASASAFGVVTLNARGLVARLDDRPAQPLARDGDPGAALVSMGVYVFDRDLLIDCLSVDVANPESSHDFARDVLPLLIRAQGLAAYEFRDARSGAAPYWRDCSGVDRYWQANMELLAEQPALDLEDPEWPLRTHVEHWPAPRFVGEGTALRSIVSGGCTVAGRVEDSLLSPGCRIRAGATVASSIVMPGVEIGRNCRIRKAIIDEGCAIPDGVVIGEDSASDSVTYKISPAGVAIVTAEGLERGGRVPAVAETKVA